LHDLSRVLAVASAIRERCLGRELVDVIDIVPASRTVLVVCANRAAARQAGNVLAELAGSDLALHESAAGGGRAESQEVEIEVSYDGEDLAEVARLARLSEDAVVAAHTGSVWRAAFGGFAPGFVYLTAGDPRLQVPRLDSPRTAVPSGAVAIAGEFSA